MTKLIQRGATFCLSLILLLYSVHSLTAERLDLRFTTLTINDGMSQNSVYTMIQDKSGFIWIGTQDGLNRFDGYKFKVYSHSHTNEKSLSSNYITALMEDNAGMIWVGTNEGGLNRFNPKTEEFITINYFDQNIKMGNNRINEIIQDQQGYIWVGTNVGLVKIDPFNFSYETLSFSHQVLSLFEDSQKTIWVGMQSGLYFYNKKENQLTKFVTPGLVNKGNVKSITQDKQGFLWFGLDAELWRLNLNIQSAENFYIEHYSEALPLYFIVDLVEDTRGYLWVATLRNGIFLIDPARKRMSNYRSDPFDNHTLPNNLVTTILEDRSDVVWIGTRIGLTKFYPTLLFWKHFKHIPNQKTSLVNNIVRSFAKHSQYEYWVGTVNGLDFYDRRSNHFRHINASSYDWFVLNDRLIYSLLKEGNYLWIGSGYEGLFKVNLSSGEVKQYSYDPLNPYSILNNAIRYVFRDTDGKLWIGTERGLNWFDEKTERFHTVELVEGINNNFHVQVIFEDSYDHLWVGTWGDGLFLIDKKNNRIEHFTYNQEEAYSISNNTILTIYEDNYQQVWIGTSGGGINRYDRATEQFVRLLVTDGLANNVIYSILEDAFHNLWIGTNHGLSVYNLDNHTFNNFDRNDGLHFDEFNAGAALKLDSGEMLMGGVYGYISFTPSHNKTYNQKAPEIAFTDFLQLNQTVLPKAINKNSILNSSINFTNDINLSYDHSSFSIEFSALHYINPKKNRYRYRLSGWDKHWIDASTDVRQATYTNLNPGEYKFQVRASNRDGIWNEKGRELKITIVPPFWQEWWARFLGISLMMLSIYLVYRYRIKSLAKTKQLLEYEVVQRTSEIERQKDELINAQKQLMLQEKMAALGTLTSGVAHEINNPTNFVHVSAQNLSVDLDEFKAFLIALTSDDADDEIIEAIRVRFFDLQEHILTIQEGSQRIKLIVHDLQSVSRLDDSDPIIASIDECVLTTVKLVQSKYKNSIQFNYTARSNPKISCWPAQLNQVFMNIMVNSCYAIEKKYVLDNVQRGAVSIDVEIVNSFVIISFQDNGIGIEREVVEKIFEPFYTTKPLGEGTGLGLSISFDIIQKHGGQISVQSELGIGTTFRIKLPLL